MTDRLNIVAEVGVDRVTFSSLILHGGDVQFLRLTPCGAGDWVRLFQLDSEGRPVAVEVLEVERAIAWSGDLGPELRRGRRVLEVARLSAGARLRRLQWRPAAGAELGYRQPRTRRGGPDA